MALLHVKIGGFRYGFCEMGVEELHKFCHGLSTRSRDIALFREVTQRAIILHSL